MAKDGATPAKLVQSKARKLIVVSANVTTSQEEEVEEEEDRVEEEMDSRNKRSNTTCARKCPWSAKTGNVSICPITRFVAFAIRDIGELTSPQLLFLSWIALSDRNAACMCVCVCVSVCVCVMGCFVSVKMEN